MKAHVDDIRTIMQSFEQEVPLQLKEEDTQSNLEEDQTVSEEYERVLDATGEVVLRKKTRPSSDPR